MTRLAALLAFLIVSLTTPALPRSARLDAPVSRAPTIRSEIRRGNTDAFNCFEEISDVTAASEYATCVMDKIAGDGYRANSSKAYLFGAYATALEMIGPMMGPRVAKFHSPDENVRAADAAADWKARLEAAISATGLTRGDFCHAVEAADLARCKSGPLPF